MSILFSSLTVTVANGFISRSDTAEASAIVLYALKSDGNFSEKNRKNWPTFRDEEIPRPNFFSNNTVVNKCNIGARQENIFCDFNVDGRKTKY